MKVRASQMKYSNIANKLQKGVALTDREEKATQREISRIAISSTRALKQLNLRGFGQVEDGGLVEQLKAGTLFPDMVFGWSTKTILAVLLGLCVLKAKASA